MARKQRGAATCRSESSSGAGQGRSCRGVCSLFRSGRLPHDCRWLGRVHRVGRIVRSFARHIFAGRSRIFRNRHSKGCQPVWHRWGLGGGFFLLAGWSIGLVGCGGARFFRCADGAGVVGSRQYCAVQPSSLVRKRRFCHPYERLCRIGDAAVRLRGRDASARCRWSLRSICGEPSDAIFRNLGLDLPLYAANGRRSVICFWLFLV